MPPVLTVRAFAEMLELPLYEQVRILEEQKYPRRKPTPYRVVYYQPALAALRDFYTSGGQLQVLQQAINAIQGSTMTYAKKKNNIRVIQSFQQSSQVRRQLAIRPRRRTEVGFHGVTLKYIPDLVGHDGVREKHVFYNVRQAPVTSGIVKTTLEITQLVLIRGGVKVALNDVEFVDLANRGRVHRITRTRKRTLKRASQNARAIGHLWPRI